jgi:hypothetical protein
MLKTLLFVPLLTAICAAELVSIANYTGKHDPTAFESKPVSGALVNDKLYTFGGWFRVSYVVDPDSFKDNFIFNQENHKNTTDSSQVYDISKDEWSFETKTPKPLRHATTQVVDKLIYFFEIGLEKRSSSMNMWKYDTESKAWSTLPDIPFLWNGNLNSCFDGQSKIYFTGSDGSDRNIIHVYDTTSDQWIKNPIFMDKRLGIKQMICKEDYIKFIAKDLKGLDDEPTSFSWSIDDGPFINDETFELFSTSYLDGSTVSDNYSLTGNYDSGSNAQYGDWVYLTNVRRTETIVYKLNIITHENITMATLPYDLSVPLVAPVNENELLLLGGAEPFQYGRTHRNDIKKYNHKLIFSQQVHDEL